MKDDVLRVRTHALRRARDMLATTEARISVLQAELAETENQVVGLSVGEHVESHGIFDRQSASFLQISRLVFHRHRD